MDYFFPLLLLAGLGGGLLLLGVASFARLAPFLKPLTALWLTLMACLWILLPDSGRWVLSVWSPSSVLGGEIIFIFTPAVWWATLALLLSFAGVVWVMVAERRTMLSLAGPLIILALITMWSVLSSASLLTTLATWAVFDLIWSAAALLAGADGEQVTFGVAVHGVSTLILWMVSLFLLRSGQSGLWWLMWPSAPMTDLLLAAALMRIGFYPFQIVFPNRLKEMHLLSLVHFLGPLTGVGLLCRLLTLPGVTRLPDWVLIWGVVSVLGNALMAWSARGQRRSLRVYHALLIAIVTGAVAAGSEPLLLVGSGVWVASLALLMLVRGRDPDAVAWSWPAWIALLFLLGVPPSPLAWLNLAWVESLPWLWRIIWMGGYALIGALLLRDGRQSPLGAATPAWMWQRMCVVWGEFVLLAALAMMAFVVPAPAFSWVALCLWLLAVAGAAALARWGMRTRQWLWRAQPILEFADLQWLYRSIWRGSEHLLGVLRAMAEVLEGSGAMLWSLLMLLLVLLVIMNR
ncbi:MAG: hypothetical protein JXA21_18780 [Anaerolineae bacterium]|nr:hypothetical protein [Anaerolineae bacterium]